MAAAAAPAAAGNEEEDNWMSLLSRRLNTLWSEDGTSSTILSSPAPPMATLSEEAAGSAAPAGAASASNARAAASSGEDEDKVGDLPPKTPPPRPKPSLDVGSIQQKLSEQQQAGGQWSFRSASGGNGGGSTTRRKWSIRMFSPNSSRGSPMTGENAIQESARMHLRQIIDVLKAPVYHEEAYIIACAKRMLALCNSTTKSAEASKYGALEIIADVVSHYRDRPDMLFELLPVLINLSAGDDPAGVQRSATLVQLGLIESLADVLRPDPPRDVAMRAIWSLQHICRRATAAASLWPAKAVSANVAQLACKLITRFPGDLSLHSRVCYTVSAVCYALSSVSSVAGLAATTGGLSPTDASAQFASVIPALATVVTAPPAIAPTTEQQAAVDAAQLDALEAAALALGDACTTAALAKAASDAGAVEGLTRAMALYDRSPSLLENACWALKQISEAGGDEVRSKLKASKATQLVVEALQATRVAPAKSGVAKLREKACGAIAAFARPQGDAALERSVKDELVDCGALGALVEALRAHIRVRSLAAAACEAIATICSGPDPGEERKEEAASAGGISALVHVLRKNPKAPEVQDRGRQALLVICHSRELQSIALSAGANPDWSPRDTPDKNRDSGGMLQAGSVGHSSMQHVSQIL